MKHNSFEPGPLAEVACEESEGRWTLVFVKDLHHPPEKVWAALTKPAQLREWAPYTADRDLGSSGSVTLTMIDSEDRQGLTTSVIRAEPPTLLEHTWGSDRLRWELVATPSGTRLILRHTVDDKELVSQVAAGWHLCLVVAERMLDGAPIGPIRGKDALNFGWQDLHIAYAHRL